MQNTGASSHNPLKVLLFLLPAAIALAVYWPVLSNGLVWDDIGFLVDTPEYQVPGLWANLLQEPFLVSINYYRPLTLLTYVAEVQAGGLVPSHLHLTNLLLHALNTVLVSLLTYRLVKTAQMNTRWIPVLAGIVYGLHPALIEATTWISGRFDLMLTTFLLLGLVFDSIQDPVKRALSIGLCFLLAALCKEMAVAFALLLPAWHLAMEPRPLLPLRQFAASVIRRGDHWAYLSIFVAGLAYLAIRYTALGYLYVKDTPMDAGNSLQHLLLTAKSFAGYISLVLWPFTQLSPIHHSDFPIELNDKLAWLSLAGLLLTILLLHKVLRAAPRIGWLALAFTLSLTPVINIIPLTIGDNIVHERFLQFPTALAVMVIAIVFAGVFRRLAENRTYRALGWLLVGFWLVLSVANIRVTIPLWHDNLTLWSWATERSPASSFAFNNLAAELEQRGYLQAARKDAETALKLDPKNFRAYAVIGNTFKKQGEYQKAVTNYKHALKIRPYDSGILINLGNTLIEMNELAMAERNLLIASAFEPRRPFAYFNLGLLYTLADKPELAQRFFLKAYSLYPPSEIQTIQKMADKFIERLRNKQRVPTANS